MKFFKKIEKKYKNLIKNKDFKKSLEKYKNSIYFREKSPTKYKSRRNKFKVFQKKLHFENTNLSQIKGINKYYFIIGLILIISSSYVLFFSDYFSIKNVEVIRNDSKSNINLAYKAVENIRFTPIIFLDKQELKDNILSYQPNLKTIEITKLYPNSLKIILESYDKLFYFESNGKKYEILENGSVIPTSSESEENLITVKGLSLYGFIDYKTIFDGNIIKSIYNSINKLKENSSFVDIKEITYYKKEYEFHIVNKDDITILFDLTKNIDNQIEKLNIFYKNYQNELKTGIKYIDLRINDKIIYCEEDYYNTCQKNLEYIYGK